MGLEFLVNTKKLFYEMPDSFIHKHVTRYVRKKEWEGTPRTDLVDRWGSYAAIVGIGAEATIVGNMLTDWHSGGATPVGLSSCGPVALSTRWSLHAIDLAEKRAKYAAYDGADVIPADYHEVRQQVKFSRYAALCQAIGFGAKGVAEILYGVRSGDYAVFRWGMSDALAGTTNIFTSLALYIADADPKAVEKIKLKSVAGELALDSKQA